MTGDYVFKIYSSYHGASYFFLRAAHHFVTQIDNTMFILET
jgi:hypothetical protein